MLNPNTLTEMQKLYSNIEINEDGTAEYPLSHLYILRIDPTHWTIYASQVKSVFEVDSRSVTAKIKDDAKDFMQTWDEIAAREEKDPIDNLKVGGFELPTEEANEVPDEKTQEADDDQKPVELVAKLEEMERLMLAKQEAEEKKMQEMDKREKAKDIEQLAMKPGGYNAKVRGVESEKNGPFSYNASTLSGDNVQEIKSKKAESIWSIPAKKPKRTIRGLTPRLAECGKIKIGKKGEMTTSSKGNTFRPPEKIDHIIVTTMEKENDDFIPDVYIMNKIGENCKAIPVRLPYDDPSLNFPTSYAYYHSAACKCRGDGETAINSDGEPIECNPETCQNIKDNKCKPNGVLSLILDDAPRVGGVYKFRTTGWNSINNVFSSMEFIRGLTNGLLAGLPLMLTLTPKHTVIPGTKTSTTIYMVNLEYRGSLQEMVSAIQQTMSTRALMQYSVKDFEKLAVEAMALPEAPEECQAIVEEFYPEAIRG